MLSLGNSSFTCARSMATSHWKHSRRTRIEWRQHTTPISQSKRCKLNWTSPLIFLTQPPLRLPPSKLSLRQTLCYSRLECTTTHIISEDADYLPIKHSPTSKLIFQLRRQICVNHKQPHNNWDTTVPMQPVKTQKRSITGGSNNRRPPPFTT